MLLKYLKHLKTTISELEHKWADFYIPIITTLVLTPLVPYVIVIFVLLCMGIEGATAREIATRLATGIFLCYSALIFGALCWGYVVFKNEQNGKE